MVKAMSGNLHLLIKDNIDGDGAQYVYKSKC